MHNNRHIHEHMSLYCVFPYMECRSLICVLSFCLFYTFYMWIEGKTLKIIVHNTFQSIFVSHNIDQMGQKSCVCIVKIPSLIKRVTKHYSPFDNIYISVAVKLWRHQKKKNKKQMHFKAVALDEIIISLNDGTMAETRKLTLICQMGSLIEHLRATKEQIKNTLGRIEIEQRTTDWGRKKGKRIFH